MIKTSTNGVEQGFIEATMLSSFIQRNLHDAILPETFYRNVTDFQNGESIDIPSIGEVNIQEVREDEPFVYSPIQTGKISMRITDQIGNAHYITDDMREDGSNIDALLAAYGEEEVYAMQKYHETRAFEVLNAAQTAGDTNEVNGFAHRLVASGTNQVIELDDISAMKLAFDKANVPAAGRILVVDPIVASTLDRRFQITSNTTDANMFFMDIMSEGFMRGRDFVAKLYSFNIITSNLLPAIESETVDGTAVTGGVANIAFSIFNDNTKPLMYAERRAPKAEFGRNKDLRRDEYTVSSRFGFGVQRRDTLGVIITSATATA